MKGRQCDTAAVSLKPEVKDVGSRIGNAVDLSYNVIKATSFPRQDI